MHRFRLLMAGSRLALACVPVLLCVAGHPTDAYADGTRESGVSGPAGLPTASRLKPGMLRRQDNGDIILDATGADGGALAPAQALPATATVPAAAGATTKPPAAVSTPTTPSATGEAVCPAAGSAPARAAAPGGNYRPRSIDLHNRVIWGARAVAPDGTGLSFGGADQRAADGRPHTCVLVDGTWVSIVDALRRDNPLQGFHDAALALAARQKRAAALTRYVFFEDLPPSDARARLTAEIRSLQNAVLGGARTLLTRLDAATGGAGPYEHSQIAHGRPMLQALVSQTDLVDAGVDQAAWSAAVGHRMQAEITLRRVADLFAAEPPARALSPIVYDRATGLYVLFGGDHFDYLRNDVWVFDPVARRWMQRHSDSAPSPRANHILTANGNGTITLTGGYTYTSATGYISAQYDNVKDGPWRFDLATNRWDGTGVAVAADSRTYRTGFFAPASYSQPPYPDRAAQVRTLSAIPANTWVALKPPLRPRLNRDWGRAVFDTDRGLLLRWSGGHSAHGGTDVIQYHLATNRWELPIPVEFPLGQLYSNTSYPRGVNFNRRPWTGGHTYNNYGYDSLSKRLVFTGSPYMIHLYDPLLGDWTYSGPKPAGMEYRASYQSLTVVATRDGLFTWGAGRRSGRLFRFLADEKKWREVKFPPGSKIPNPSTDRASAVYDSKRDRILLFSKHFRKPYNGLVYAIGLPGYDVAVLSPERRSNARTIPYLARSQYDAENDLVVFGATFKPDAAGALRMPAYDPEGNRWVSLRIGGTHPTGKKGRNVSLGFLYDADRRLFWATDAWNHIFVMRLEPDKADMQPLK